MPDNYSEYIGGCGSESGLPPHHKPSSGIVPYTAGECGGVLKSDVKKYLAATLAVTHMQ